MTFILTSEDYFGRMTHIEPPSDEVKANADILIDKVNQLLAECPADVQPDGMNSGWRPASYNAKVPGAAVKSKHITGQAVDLGDPDGALDDYLLHRQGLLSKYGLHMEHPLATKGWCHLQSVPPRSGNYVFFP